jgi:hypothetical protein
MSYTNYTYFFYLEGCRERIKKEFFWIHLEKKLSSNTISLIKILRHFSLVKINF